MKNLPRLLIGGQGRHGKDEAALYLCKHYGFKAESSSHAAARIFIFDILKNSDILVGGNTLINRLKLLFGLKKTGYKTVEECFEDRHNHRELWYRLICLYNREDKAALAKEIMKDNQIYCGMRDKDELFACKNNVFDCTIWIDGSKRVEYVEDSSSINVDSSMFEEIIDNNSTLEDFYKNLDGLMDKLGVSKL